MRFISAVKQIADAGKNRIDYDLEQVCCFYVCLQNVFLSTCLYLPKLRMTNE